jgi:hypothetical protein
LITTVATRFISQLHLPLNPLPAIGDNILQAGPFHYHLFPTLPSAIQTSLSRRPSHTGRLDCHQNRLIVKEISSKYNVKTNFCHMQDMTELLTDVLHSASRTGAIEQYEHAATPSVPA